MIRILPATLLCTLFFISCQDQSIETTDHSNSATAKPIGQDDISDQTSSLQTNLHQPNSTAIKLKDELNGSEKEEDLDCFAMIKRRYGKETKKNKIAFQTKTEPSDAEKYKDILDEMLPPIQEFSIDCSKDTVLISESCVEVKIPAYSFQFEDGRVPQGNVKFTMQEFNDFASMMAGNYTTSTVNHHLQSAGMFDLKASSKGEELKLKRFTDLEIFVPNLENDKMSLYYGKQDENGEMIWTKDETSKEKYPVVKCIGGEHADLVNPFFERNFRFDKKEMLKMDGKYISYLICFDQLATKEQCEYYAPGKKIGHDKGIQRLEYMFKDSLPKQVTANNYIKLAFQVQAFDDKESYKESVRLAEIKKKKRIAKEKMLAAETAALKNDLGANSYQRDRKGISFYAGSLGPINVDCQVLDIVYEPKGTELLVKGLSEQEDLKMLFCDKRSFLSGSNFNEEKAVRFKGLPKEEHAVVFFSKLEGDDILLYSKSVKTKDTKKIEYSDFRVERLANAKELRNRIGEL